MRERKGLGAPVPDSAPVAVPTDARSRIAAVAEAVPDRGTGAICLVIGARSWPLVGTRMLVGRAGGDAHIEVDDTSISRRHAELVATGASWVLRDLGSTNGTWVGGRRLPAGEAAELTTGTTVRFGTVEATFRPEAGAG